jgi:hypothetical protein
LMIETPADYRSFIILSNLQSVRLRLGFGVLLFSYIQNWHKKTPELPEFHFNTILRTI